MRIASLINGLIIAAIAMVAQACQCPRRALPPAQLQVDNVFRGSATIPENIRRVAVLPITGELGDWEAADSRVTLEPVLLQELIKAKRFEAIPITPGQLQAWTERPAWQVEDRLPWNLFVKIQERTGCDAVLFCRLQRYQAYEPIVVSWNLKLVDAADGKMLWAADQIFDGSHPDVARAARCYAGESNESWLENDWKGILLSPRRFTQFTLNSLFQTLPQRQL